MKRFSRVVALLLGLLAAGGALAQSDELQEISRLMRQGQHAQALDRVNALLATRPRDAQGRFLKGLILTEQKKVPEAIEVFTRLSQDYPELPEPYNNLAVLYAAQGQYEKARQALETSIRTHPSYATAYENLGDVYTKLASQAYDKALQLDSGNSGAQSKLSLIRDLLTASGRTAPRPGTSVAAARSEPVRVAAADTERPAAKAPEAGKGPAAADAKTTPRNAPVEPKPQEPKSPGTAKPQAEPRAAEARPAQATAAAGAKAADRAREAPPQAAPGEEALAAVRAWAAAWSRKDIDAYLALYAKDFKTPNGEARAAWEAGRRTRISAPKKIEVSIETPKVTLGDNGGSATVSFRQHYRSDTLKTSSGKTLVLERTNGKWLIRQERVGS